MLTKYFGPAKQILALTGEEVQKNLLNFTNEGLLWKASILLVNISHFFIGTHSLKIKNHFCHWLLLSCNKSCAFFCKIVYTKLMF